MSQPRKTTLVEEVDVDALADQMASTAISKKKTKSKKEPEVGEKKTKGRKKQPKQPKQPEVKELVEEVKIPKKKASKKKTTTKTNLADADLLEKKKALAEKKKRLLAELAELRESESQLNM
jgi:hypothetical protein